MLQVSGTFVSLKNNVLTLSHGGGKKNTTHTLAPDVTATIDGQAAKVEDVEVGDSVSISGDPVTSVSANR